MSLNLEIIQESETHGIEINEMIKLVGSLPIRKKKLVVSMQNYIKEMAEFEDTDVENDYQKAIEFIQNLEEDEVEEVCYYIADLYKDVEL